jgi:hypothetical protein
MKDKIIYNIILILIGLIIFDTIWLPGTEIGYSLGKILVSLLVLSGVILLFQNPKK